MSENAVNVKRKGILQVACYIDGMADKQKLLKVFGVQLEDEASFPVVLVGTPDGARSFSLTVGPYEASAIVMEMEGLVTSRPLTHDILAQMFERHGYTLDAVELYALSLEGVLARLVYHQRLRRWELEVRPSDGIALALRLNAPITCDSALLERLDPGAGDPVPFPVKTRDAEIGQRRLRGACSD